MGLSGFFHWLLKMAPLLLVGLPQISWSHASCNDSLRVRQAKAIAALRPLRQSREGAESQVRPIIEMAQTHFQQSPQSTVNLLVPLLYKTSLSGYSWLYLRTIETMIRDIFVLNATTPHIGNRYRQITPRLIQIITQMEGQYSKSDFDFKSVTYGDEVIYYNLMVTINEMLEATPDDFGYISNSRERRLLATAEHNAGLEILKAMQVRPIFSHFLLTREKGLVSLLLATNETRIRALKVIQKLGAGEADFVLALIGKILNLDWTGNEIFFCDLIQSLYRTVSYEPNAKIDFNSNQSIDNQIKYDLYAPIRDSELYILNLISKHLKVLGEHKVAISDLGAKLRALLKALMTRPFGLATDNRRTLLQNLAKAALTKELPSVVEDDILALFQSTSEKWISDYIDIKSSLTQNDSGQLKTSSFAEEITFF